MNTPSQCRKGKVSVDATFVQKDAADANQNSAAEKSKVIKLQIGSRIVNVDNEAVIYDAAPVIRNAQNSGSYQNRYRNSGRQG